jgi:AcrR family transcriptional regulator
MAVPARTRRRPAEVRALLLEAAERLFARKGYADTTTDDIAADAGVTRSVMYRHFPSKADLFREAVLNPFMEFLRDYRSVWQSQLDHRWHEDKVMTTMVSLLYDSIRSHRDAVVGLVSAQAAMQPDVTREVDRLFDEFFADMLVIGQDTSRPLGWIPTDEDLELSIRLVLGMVAAAAVLDPIFLPKGRRRPSRDQIIDRLAALALYGLRLRPQ